MNIIIEIFLFICFIFIALAMIGFIIEVIKMLWQRLPTIIVVGLFIIIIELLTK